MIFVSDHVVRQMVGFVLFSKGIPWTIFDPHVITMSNES